MRKIATPFSGKMEGKRPLDGHPNPYFERENILNLNGYWDFSLDKSPLSPKEYETKILVPFSVESPLSGVEKEVKKDDYLHYRKRVSIPRAFRNEKARLVFSAIDQVAKVYVDGEFLGENDFGYGIFDVLFDLKGREEVTIEVLAKDDTASPDHARGKQSFRPGGIWYTPTSGIWGSVYLEFLPLSGYLKKLEATPSFDEKKVLIKAEIEGKDESALARIYFEDKFLEEKRLDEKGEASFDLSSDFHPWNMENPNLYHYEIRLGKDHVKSVFAFRKIERVEIGGMPFLLLGSTYPCGWSR